MNTGHVLSPEQAAAVAAAVAGQSFKMPAFAGAGKTSTVEEIAIAIAPRPMLYIAYNTTMAASTRRRFRPLRHVKVTTGHALAFHDVGSTYGDRLQTRNIAILEAIEQQYTAELMQICYSTRKAADAVYGTIVAYQNSPDRDLRYAHVPEDSGVIASRRVIADLAQRVFDAMTSADGDFPLTHDTYFKYWQAITQPRLDEQYELIAVDEAQDSNPTLLAVLGDQRCQKIFVGDEHQSLYSFRAATNALRTVALPELPLTQSWRFGDNVARYANAVLRVKGEKRRLRGNPGRVDVVVQSTDDEPDMVLARTNAGVFEEALGFVARGRGVAIIGGVDELIGMVLGAYELNVHGRSTHPAFRFFRSWEDLCEAAKGARGADYGPFVRIVERYGMTIPEACAQIRNGVGGADAVHLSTVHKAKGLEAGHVRLAADFAPFCKYDPKKRKIVFSDDEANIHYVAITRAERVLELGQFAGVLSSSITLARKLRKLQGGGIQQDDELLITQTPARADRRDSERTAAAR